MNFDDLRPTSPEMDRAQGRTPFIAALTVHATFPTTEPAVRHRVTMQRRDFTRGAEGNWIEGGRPVVSDLNDALNLFTHRLSKDLPPVNG